MTGSWLLWFGAAVVLYLALRLLAEPARYLALFLLRGTAGYLALLAVNVVGLAWGLHLPLNPAAALVTGVLGVPGLVVLALLQKLYT